MTEEKTNENENSKAESESTEEDKFERRKRREERREWRRAHRHHLPNLLGGLIFIIAGAILLLNNFNYIPWSIWNYMANFWPVILIFIGLDLFSGNSWPLKFLTTIIGLAIICLILLYSLTAVDYNFQTAVFNKFPLWKSIYQKTTKGNTQNQNLFYDGGTNYDWGGDYYRN